MLKLEISFWKKALKGRSEIKWCDITSALKKAGIQEAYFDTKGSVTKVAKTMTAYANNLTAAQLSEIIEPRKSREKMY